MANRTSPSPSSSRLRRTALSPSKSVDQLAAELGLGTNKLEDEDDEDEETLQLKLQEIQARLKLKKLQSAQAKEQAGRKPGDNPARAGSALLSPGRQRQAALLHESGANEDSKPAVKDAVQVPASPVRKCRISQPQTSPSRILLGIDKGLKAKDVSLKRAPSHKQRQHERDSSEREGYLRRSRTPSAANLPQTVSKPASFSERLASLRTEEGLTAQKRERIQNARTRSFGIGQEEIEQLKKSAVEIPDQPLEAPQFTREEVLRKPGSQASILPRSQTMPTLRSGNEPDGSSVLSVSMERAQDGRSTVADENASSFEPYSSFHLSKRIVPHAILTRNISGKSLFSIKDLFKVVRAPDFALPDVEEDIVVFAILARKSEPRQHKGAPGKRAEERGKYMVMTLVDLKLDLDLFLFNSGFTRFWKLTEGTVIAILNPIIMPPPPGRQDTGRFSLAINSEDDTVIEIGSARDLGFCQSVKKDGQPCMAWVNKKRTHFCEFHSNEAVTKQRRGRIELNASGFGGGGGRRATKEHLPKEPSGGKQWDFDSRSQFFTSRSFSAADLLDGKDRAPADTKERAKFLKRGLEAKERERDMMKKLGQVGSAAGREYMLHARSKAPSASKGVSSASRAGPSGEVASESDQAARALSLGLQQRKHAVHLSPVKRKRPDGSRAPPSAGASAPAPPSSSLGWGSGLRDKLARMKEGEALRPSGTGGSESPTRKKTRFVTEKGIREAGRESLGMDLSRGRAVVRLDKEDDDDDELVIVK